MVRVYPTSTFEKFEFDRILSKLKEYCISSLGRNKVDNLFFYTNEDALEEELALVHEFLELEQSAHKAIIEGYFAVEPYIPLIQTNQYALGVDELDEIKQLSQTVSKWHKLIKTEDFEFFRIKELITATPAEKDIHTVISKIVDTNKRIKDKASNKLLTIRTELRENQQKLSVVFNQALRKYRDMGYLAETKESVRGGRKVLAVKAEYKRKIKGILHDLSDTGLTAYIEPSNAVKLSNTIVELQQEERSEIYKILQELTAFLRPHCDTLSSFQDLVTVIDFCRAKARLGIHLKAGLVKVSRKAETKLVEAYHPLLRLKNDAQNKKTMSLDIELIDKPRVIVISGPNAGGKSVALKTVGLLQLMFQSGMMIPASSQSVMGCYSIILSDIGDEQSIDNELSTYSSKLKNMAFFLKHASERSLFLIDEFGSGSDPSLGGSVAQAILEQLIDSKAKGVVTTHYFNLKTFASRSEYAENAAMLFDEHSLQPLFKIKIGKPGSSYTFAIAQNSGLPNSVVEKAKSLSNSDQLDLDELLTGTQRKESELMLQQSELNSQRIRLNEKQEEITRLKEKLKEQKQHYTIHKKDEERKVAVEVKKRWDELVKKWEKTTNKSNAAQEIRASLKNEVATTSKIIKESKKNAQSGVGIKQDSFVNWLESQEVGKVLAINKNKATVQFGNMKMEIPISDLQLSEQVLQSKKSSKRSGQYERLLQFDIEKDIRGMRALDAEKELLAYFDSAVLAGINKLFILHGKGSGVLRKMVAEIARQYEAKSVSHPHPEEGGDGISIIEMQ